MIVTDFNTTLKPKSRSHSIYLSLSRALSLSGALPCSFSLPRSFSLFLTFPALSRSFISAAIHLILMQLNERDSMHTNRYRHTHTQFRGSFSQTANFIQWIWQWIFILSAVNVIWLAFYDDKIWKVHIIQEL